jgi:hypothetical protein
MEVADLLAEAYGRIREAVHEVTDGLSEDQLAARPDPDANSIAWLVWHLARVQDDHVADVAGLEQVYTAQGFAERFDLPFQPTPTGAMRDRASSLGYEHSSEQVGAVKAPSSLLVAYYDAVHEQSLQYLRTLRPEDLDRVVDESWDPPVTLGVRLVSVLSDDLQHAGQSAYIRGMLERAERPASN